MEKEVKLCKDCKHFRVINLGQIEGIPQCTHSQATTVCLVTGNKSYSTCSGERLSLSMGRCGPNGDWWELREKKKSFWSKVVDHFGLNE